MNENAIGCMNTRDSVMILKHIQNSEINRDEYFEIGKEILNGQAVTKISFRPEPNYFFRISYLGGQHKGLNRVYLNPYNPGYCNKQINFIGMWKTPDKETVEELFTNWLITIKNEISQINEFKFLTSFPEVQNIIVKHEETSQPLFAGLGMFVSSFENILYETREVIHEIISFDTGRLSPYYVAILMSDSTASPISKYLLTIINKHLELHSNSNIEIHQRIIYSDEEKNFLKNLGKELKSCIYKSGELRNSLVHATWKEYSIENYFGLKAHKDNLGSEYKPIEMDFSVEIFSKYRASFTYLSFCIKKLRYFILGKINKNTVAKEDFLTIEKLMKECDLARLKNMPKSELITSIATTVTYEDMQN